MKKLLFILVIIGLVISSAQVYAAGLSANRILNPGFDQDTWWGTGLVLAYRWNRFPADNQYNRTTTDACIGNGALFVQASPTLTYTGWSSALRVAVKPGATYTCSVWAKWDGCTTANGIQMNVIVHDDALPTNVVGTYIAIATTGSSGGNWVKLTGSVTIPSNGACAHIFLGTVGANTETWVIFDEVKMQTENDPNLLYNAGFEAYEVSGYPTYWRRNTSEPRASWTKDTFHSGTACTWIRQSTAAGYRMWYNAQGATRSLVAVEENKKYVYGGWMMWSNITAGAAGIGIHWFNGQDSTLNNDAVSTTGQSADLITPPNTSIIVTTTNVTWTYLIATATPPAGAKYARFILWNASTAIQPPDGEAISYYDDVVFKDLPPVIEVTPASANISLGKTQIFGATGGSQPYTWTSSDTTVGSIDANSGLFTALSLGTTIITATDNDGFTGTATVVVIATKAPLSNEPPSVMFQRMIPFGELYE
ncbi:MAG: Ig-like domain-containing protein [bacterium]|nr:Ig-like domain-containing protein [bacterium]